MSSFLLLLLKIPDTRGDWKFANEIGKRPLFYPVLPKDRMEWLRKLFFLDQKRRDMGLYFDLEVQFGSNVDLPDPNVEFLMVESLLGTAGECNIWQANDLPSQTELYWSGSRLYKCILNSEAVDRITNSDKELEDSKGIELIQRLNTILKLDDTIISNCHRIREGTISRTGTTTADELGEDCVWQIFDGNNEFWEGAWVAYMAVNTDFWREEFKKLWSPLYSKFFTALSSLFSKYDVGVPAILFAGEATCPRHTGYQQGGYFSGLEKFNQYLEFKLSPEEYAAWKEVATPFLCDDTVEPLPFLTADSFSPKSSQGVELEDFVDLYDEYGDFE